MRGVDKSHTLLNNSLDIHSQYVILTFKDNWIEHLTTDQKVWGSNPYGRALLLVARPSNWRRQWIWNLYIQFGYAINKEKCIGI